MLWSDTHWSPGKDLRKIIWILSNYSPRCHLGQSIIYDTVTELNWSVNVAAHRIRTVIDSLLSNDWKDGKPLPDITLEDDCIVSAHNALHLSCVIDVFYRIVIAGNS